MKKIMSLILVVSMIIGSAIMLTSCGDDDECYACGGTGYFQKKDCPLC